MVGAQGQAKWAKSPTLMTPLTKKPHPQAKNFFRLQSRLADPFEPLNSSLAQWAEELGRW